MILMLKMILLTCRPDAERIEDEEFNQDGGG